MFLAEGPQAIREALRRTVAEAGTCSELFLTPSAADRHADLVSMAREVGVAVVVVSDRAAALLSETRSPQGIVAVCRSLDVGLDEAMRAASQGTALPLVVVLADVRDPGNAGTILRTADAAGAAAVVFAGDCVDPHNGKCVRSSAGSIFHPRIARVSDVEVALDGARRAGLTVLTTEGSAETDLDAMSRAGELNRPTAWVFGNEAAGVSAAVSAAADRAVRIPIHGRAESLNVGAAAAVVLYASASALLRSRPRPTGTTSTGAADAAGTL